MENERILLEQWKDQYQSIYLTEVQDIEFIWREISRAEFKKAMEYYEDPLERSEFICRLCVLDPVEVDYSVNCPAGIPDVLAEFILEESGFSKDTGKLKELEITYDKEMESFDNQVSCVIAEAFPNFSIEEIDYWSMEKTMRYYSRAKWVLKVCRGIELVPEDELERQLELEKAEANKHPALRGR